MNYSNVKKLICCLILILLPWNFIWAQNYFGQEDSVIDIPCNNNSFYGASSNTIRELQMNGQTIVDMGVVATAPFPTILSMAFANDFMNGSTNRTFYSSIAIPSTILKYTGTSWSTVATDSLIYGNAGGYGDSIYWSCHFRWRFNSPPPAHAPSARPSCRKARCTSSSCRAAGARPSI